jgi:hypothetical protein
MALKPSDQSWIVSNLANAVVPKTGKALILDKRPSSCHLTGAHIIGLVIVATKAYPGGFVSSQARQQPSFSLLD